MDENEKPKAMSRAIRIDEARIRGHLGEMVRRTVEEALNAILDAEAAGDDTGAETRARVTCPPPFGSSLMTRGCGFEIGSRVGRSGQAHPARSPQVAQASGALRAVSGSRARSAV